MRIAVRSNNVLSSVRHERVVHLREIVFRNAVVGVNYKEPVVIFNAVVVAYPVHEIAVSIPDRSLVRVIVLVNGRALASRNFGSRVRAVVRHDEHL